MFGLAALFLTLLPVMDVNNIISDSTYKSDLNWWNSWAAPVAVIGVFLLSAVATSGWPRKRIEPEEAMAA